MKRVIVNVATGPYTVGQMRLIDALAGLRVSEDQRMWYGVLPDGCPPHSEVQYAFKAYALKRLADEGYDCLLWCDASIVAIRSLEPIWQRIETDGYWICRNGWNNAEWTADSAYNDLFAAEWDQDMSVRKLNATIPHVVATAFGINVRHEIGRAFLAEYYHLASETRAFCGPWTNANYGSPTPDVLHRLMSPTCYICGPANVRGHRHDQTAASVIAWRLGMKLDDPPHFFSYDGGQVETTVLVARGL